MEQKRTPAIFKFETRPHILVVEAPFYQDVGVMQLKGADAVLERAGVSVEIISVPGALEIPTAIMYAIRAMDFDPTRKRADGYLALGCVIKGGTMHDEIVAKESARGLQDLALQYTLAIGNGILTVENKEQALERADPARMDRAGAAAEAVLRMIELKQKFNLTPKRRWMVKK